ncbi:homoserine kinase [Deferrisoma camini]|uniref:homoserine kinase n=1 Tax=Deferrisoma camini TaxID=1035120 RepID=UPI00046C9C36|nr:homoserine kinase [Deferrisoma camini]
MAVYTEVSAEEAGRFLAARGIGPLEALEPIGQGIENTNYRVRAGGRGYVLTLLERETLDRARETMALARELARRGVPCPEPVEGPEGLVGTLAGRPAVVVPWVEGEMDLRPRPERLEALGRCLGRLHRQGQGLGVSRQGPQVAAELAELARAVAAALEPARPEVAALLRDEAAFQEGVPEDAVPWGLVHGDLFLDNVLFEPGGPEVRAVLDLHMAGRGPLPYDPAVTILDAAWAEQGPDPDRVWALLRGYNGEAPAALDPAALGPWLRRAALRFLCLRIERAWLPGRAMVAGTPKDPVEFQRKLEALRCGP